MIGPIYRWWFYRRWDKPENRALILYAERRHGLHPRRGEWPSEFFARVSFCEDLLEAQAEIERTARLRETAWLN